jgi:hypothetical protein
MVLLVLLGDYHRAKNLYSRIHSALSLSFYSSVTATKTMDILWELVEALLQKDSSRVFNTLEQKLCSTISLPVCDKIRMVLRQRFAYQMATTFSSIRLPVAAQYLGFSTDIKACWSYLKEHGWTLSPSTIATTTENDSVMDDTYLLPPSVKQPLLVWSSKTSLLIDGSELHQKMSALTEMVAFMEQKRTNT